MFNSKTKKEEVYSSTNMSDLFSSPVFYSVIALAVILGLSSTFGFFNNPHKLKTVVDVISQSIAVKPNSNAVSFEAEDEYLLRNYSILSMSVDLNEPTTSVETNDPYTLSSKLIVLQPAFNSESNKDIQKVSFDYDITSKQFWGGLDASRIESAIEESHRKSRDSVMIGVPLSTEYFLEEGDAKYSMSAGILRL